MMIYTVMIEDEQKEEDVEKDQLNNKNGIDNDESSEKSKRDVPTNTNKENEVKVPNEMKTAFLEF